IYEVNKASIEVYHLIEGKYQLLPANERGHYPISALGIELGIWQGEYQNMELPWLRLWDLAGNLLLSGEERAEQEYQRAELEMQRAELERQKAEQERQNAEREYQNAERERQKNDRLIAQLRSLGIEPEV
ncbi:hypothetical protein MEN41_08960, partial [Dolichospermum sp. ST_con]|nr:hypothetical protein [Dolichospermum sp. ST_con]